jgi:hypothetical protein
VLDDYRKVDGVMLPHRISISKGGAHYADVRFTSASVNEADALAVFNIPTEAAGAAAEVAAGDSEYSPLTLTAIADDVYFAQGYSHHSLVVAFPSYLAVIEAPYTQAQSRTLVKLLSSQFPGKPVRYLAVDASPLRSYGRGTQRRSRRRHHSRRAPARSSHARAADRPSHQPRR